MLRCGPQKKFRRCEIEAPGKAAPAPIADTRLPTICGRAIQLHLILRMAKATDELSMHLSYIVYSAGL